VIHAPHKPGGNGSSDSHMTVLLRWIKWASPWVALGLALALAAVTLRPELLQRGPAAEGGPPPGEPLAVTVPTPAGNQAEAPASVPIEPDTVPGSLVSYVDAVENSAPAVVNVYTERVVRVPSVRNLPPELAPFFGDMWNSYRERVERSLGSGVIYDRAGHVVTNYHVIAGATQISVQLRDGREAAAELVGSDRDTDLVVLQVRLSKLPEIRLGRSDRLQVGEPVLAIGNPMGLGQTVTQGIVSATGRGRLGVSTFENFIQTDAAINFGNSGGALVNASGELVGINTAIIARNAGIEGIGFAIPVDLVRGVVDAIVRQGRVVRGWIGIRPQSLKAEESRQFGFPQGSVIVTAVYRGAPAVTEGVRPGDVITQVNGQAINGAEDLLARIAGLAPGDSVRLTVRRGPPFEGQPREHTVQIKVIERPAQAAASS
jgi:serine protease DegS